MKFSIKIFLSLFLIIGTVAYAADTASILPPAKTQFLDSNGKPLTSGTVDMYIPSTTTRKATWQDAAETILNTNPVVLDAAGRALILGSGSYRQIVKDRNNNIIWDQVTSSGGSGGSSPTATGDGDLVGTIKPWAGMTAPNQYMLTYGQEVSRTGFATLFTTITSSQGVFCTSGSAVLAGLSDTTNFPIGAKVEISCLAAGVSTIISKTSTTITLAANANVTTNATAVIFPWGNGNAVTTFNLPDFRGLVPSGNNNMGGVASANLTTTYFGPDDPNSIGGKGGLQSHNLNAGENGPHSHTIFPIDPTHVHTITTLGLVAVNNGGGASQGNLLTTSGGSPTTVNVAAHLTGVTLNSAVDGSGTANTTTFSGSGTPFSIVQPTRTANFIVKVTPDANSATASGVTSLGGMTGSIACGAGLLCTGNIISNSLTTISTNNIVYTAPYLASFARTQSSVNAQLISILDFGCIADSGVTDNGPCLRAAFDAAAIAGKSIFIPSSFNYYGVTTCRNNAVFDSSGVNGNKAVSIYGDGWNDKPFATPIGSWLLPNSTFPSTCSLFRGSGTDKVTGRIFKNWGWGEAGGSIGTPKGLNGIFIDASNPAYYEANMVIDHIYIGNMAVGKSIKIVTGSSATPGGVPELLITNSVFKNFEADFLADHVTAVYNSVGQNTTNDARNVGFLFAKCDGCTTTTISYNNISNTSGAIISDNSIGLIADGNEIEQPPFTNLNGKQIWLRGTGGVVISPRVTGNKLSTENAVNTVSPITVDNAQDAQISGGWINLPVASILPHVTTTGSASGTTIRDISCYLGGTHTFGCTITNSGFYTGLLDQVSLNLSGISDGKVGKLSAPANANSLLWTLPSTSGTLALTAGSTIPSVVQGDMLYATAVNVLSALSKSSTSSSYLANNGTSNNPVWAQLPFVIANNFAGADTGAKINAAIASLGSTGGRVELVNGAYTGIGTSIAITGAPIRLNLNNSTLTFNSGVAGITCKTAAAAFSTVYNGSIISSNVALGTNDGLTVSCPFFVGSQLKFTSFGRDGVAVLSNAASTPINEKADNWWLPNVLAISNFRDGFHVDGTDSNNGQCDRCEAQGYAVNGFYDNSFIGNVYNAPNADNLSIAGAGTVAFNLAGSGITVNGGFCERVTDTVSITGGGNTYYSSAIAKCTIPPLSGGAAFTNQVMRYDTAGYPAWANFGTSVTNSSASGSPHTYGFRSNESSGNFEAMDRATGLSILTYDPVLAKWTTPAEVDLTDNLFFIQNAADNTKKARFSSAGITTATTRTFALPDISDTLATLTATQTISNKTLNQPNIVGTTTNNNAAAGSVGEFQTASSSLTSVSTGVAINATSLSLTAGDWDVSWVVISSANNASTNVTSITGSISTTSLTHSFTTGDYAQLNYGAGGIVPGSGAATTANGPTKRISIASTTTVYIVASSTFSVSTNQMNGFISARRVR